MSKPVLRILKFPLYLVLFLLFVFITYIAYGYFVSEIYDFPEPKPFTGDRLYNPYDNLYPHWYKANFHAHSYAWGGLTNGKQTEEEVIQKYRQENYDLIYLSNYHKIYLTYPPGNPSSLSVYEHGYNTTKAHRLVFGAESPSYFDIPIYLNTSAKQYLINELKKDSKMLAIAHPAFHNGHTPHELRYLSGYDLMEVLNHYRVSDVYWDSALSSGKAVWLISDDDTHDINDPVETGVCWTLVNSPDKNADDIMNSLKTGKAVGLKGKNFENPLILESVTIDSMTVNYKFNMPANIKLIGDNGIVKAESGNSDSISYTFKPEDTYLRAVVNTPDSVSFLYLNPVIRYDGGAPPSNPFTAKVNYFQSYLIRVLILIPYLLLIYFIYRKIRNKKRKNSYI
ncbi:MAG: hypothetical protein KDC73_03915 [Ignavibacteriae bacterium]|nr:hypothetical protein [Ignavibacteriota bacterium]MCB9244133.1 hypothetical protein [Ignavibacteriales bacterium]